MAIVTVLSWKVFFDPEPIPAGTAAAYATAVSIFTGAAGLLEYLLDRADRARDARKRK